MTADRPYPPGTHETKRAQEVTFYALAYGFLKSDQFAAYKPSTKTQYRQGLTKFLRIAPNNGRIDMASAIITIKDMQQQGNQTGKADQLYAVRSAIAWGQKSGFFDSETSELANRLIDSRKRVQKPITPLSEAEFKRLFEAARSNKRDLALIATIVVTQPTLAELSSLKKESVLTDNDGHTVFQIGDNYVQIPPEITPVILGYAESLKTSSALFPNPNAKDKSEPMTRAAVDLILKKYRGQAQLPSLSHFVLVRTGQEHLRNNTPRTHRKPYNPSPIHTPQTPLP